MLKRDLILENVINEKNFKNKLILKYLNETIYAPLFYALFFLIYNNH